MVLTILHPVFKVDRHEYLRSPRVGRGPFSNLTLGMTVAVVQNLLYALIGYGRNAVGALLRNRPVANIAMLPITFHLPPTASLIMLAGIYYGAQYGGSTTPILVNLPGEASSVVTCIDGYQMARRPRGAALPISALGRSSPARSARSSSCCSPSR